MKMHTYVCKSCGKEFESRIRNRSYCSKSCHDATQKAEGWRSTKRICVRCGKEYLPCCVEQKYCNRQCSGNVIGSQNKNSVMVVCERCGKSFERRVSAVSNFEHHYCSKECMKIPIKTKTCENCGKEYSVTSAHWKTSRFCSYSCANSGEFCWTHGLTKETDPRLAAKAEKTSKTIAQRLVDGTWPKAYTQYTTGHYTSPKANKPLWYRSSYELRVMVCFDQDASVIHYEVEPLCIKYGNGKRYVPDFLVLHKDGSRELVECKGRHLLDCAAPKIVAGKTYCTENNMIFRLMTLPDIKQYEESLGIINANP